MRVHLPVLVCAAVILSCGDGPLPPGAATTGTIEVVVSTTGVDLDPSGYLFLIDGERPTQIAINSRTVSPGWPLGAHEVRIDAVAANCVSTQGDRQTVQVGAGGEAPQTVSVTFQLTCTRTDKFAFARTQLSFYYGQYPVITVAYADGSDPVGRGFGDASSWSPDGDRLVIASLECYYGPCRRDGLWLLEGDPPASFALTRGHDSDPAWNPVHPLIVFVRGQRLYQIHPEGGGETRFPGEIPDVAVSEPAWSADGTRLAFTCEMEPGNRDLCVVNRDGTGFLRLTSGMEEDFHPAWRPDGSIIAFVTTRFTEGLDIAIMTPDGGDVIRVTAGSDPSWLPGGEGLIFSHADCPDGIPCADQGLWTVRLDGTGLKQITSGWDNDPLWRP